MVLKLLLQLKTRPTRSEVAELSDVGGGVKGTLTFVISRLLGYYRIFISSLLDVS